MTTLTHRKCVFCRHRRSWLVRGACADGYAWLQHLCSKACGRAWVAQLTLGGTYMRVDHELEKLNNSTLPELP